MRVSRGDISFKEGTPENLTRSIIRAVADFAEERTREVEINLGGSLDFNIHRISWHGGLIGREGLEEKLNEYSEYISMGYIYVYYILEPDERILLGQFKQS